MTLHPAIAEATARYRQLDDAVKSGRIQLDYAVQNYAWLARKDLPGSLQMARTNAAENTSANDNDASIPWTISVTEEDRDGDVVVAEGCRLEQYALNPCIFFGHQEKPIPIAKSVDPQGRLTVQVMKDRVRAVAYFDQHDEDAMNIYGKVKRGFLSAASVAFVPVEAYRREDVVKAHQHEGGASGWIFKVWSMTEWSVVGVPSCASAIRDELDREKSFTSPRLQKALGAYAAVAKGCWGGWCPVETKAVQKNALSDFVRRVGGTLNEQPIFTALDTYESGKQLAQSQGGKQVRATTGIDGSPIETWRLSFPEGDVLLTYGQYGKNKPWKMQINRAKSLTTKHACGCTAACKCGKSVTKGYSEFDAALTLAIKRLREFGDEQTKRNRPSKETTAGLRNIALEEQVGLKRIIEGLSKKEKVQAERELDSRLWGYTRAFMSARLTVTKKYDVKPFNGKYSVYEDGNRVAGPFDSRSQAEAEVKRREGGYEPILLAEDDDVEKGLWGWLTGTDQKVIYNKNGWKLVESYEGNFPTYTVVDPQGNKAESSSMKDVAVSMLQQFASGKQKGHVRKDALYRACVALADKAGLAASMAGQIALRAAKIAGRLGLTAFDLVDSFVDPSRHTGELDWSLLPRIWSDLTGKQLKRKDWHAMRTKMTVGRTSPGFPNVVVVDGEEFYKGSKRGTNNATGLPAIEYTNEDGGVVWVLQDGTIDDNFKSKSLRRKDNTADTEYDQGYTAAWDGRARSTNPYRTAAQDVDAAADWDAGWQDGAKERLAGRKSLAKGKTPAYYAGVQAGAKFGYGGGNDKNPYPKSDDANYYAWEEGWVEGHKRAKNDPKPLKGHTVQRYITVNGVRYKAMGEASGAAGGYAEKDEPARKPGVCVVCGKAFPPGTNVRPAAPSGWMHVSCAKLNKSHRCTFCKGTGSGLGRRGDCPDCGGRGAIKMKQQQRHKAMDDEQVAMADDADVAKADSPPHEVALAHLYNHAKSEQQYVTEALEGITPFDANTGEANKAHGALKDYGEQVGQRMESLKGMFDEHCEGKDIDEAVKALGDDEQVQMDLGDDDTVEMDLGDDATGEANLVQNYEVPPGDEVTMDLDETETVENDFDDDVEMAEDDDVTKAEGEPDEFADDHDTEEILERYQKGTSPRMAASDRKCDLCGKTIPAGKEYYKLTASDVGMPGNGQVYICTSCISKKSIRWSTRKAPAGRVAQVLRQGGRVVSKGGRKWLVASVVRKGAPKFKEGDNVRYSSSFLQQIGAGGEEADMKGQVIEVRTGAPFNRYKVRWSDGNESTAMETALQRGKSYQRRKDFTTDDADVPQQKELPPEHAEAVKSCGAAMKGLANMPDMPEHHKSALDMHGDALASGDPDAVGKALKHMKSLAGAEDVPDHHKDALNFHAKAMAKALKAMDVEEPEEKEEEVVETKADEPPPDEMQSKAVAGSLKPGDKITPSNSSSNPVTGVVVEVNGSKVTVKWDDDGTTEERYIGDIRKKSVKDDNHRALFATLAKDLDDLNRTKRRVGII